MRAARIENGIVADLWEVPSLDCYGDLYTLIEAPEWVQVGATWDGQAFTNPDPPPKTREQLIAEIDRQRDEALAAGFVFNDVLYYCDLEFQSQVQAFILAWQTGVLSADESVAIRRKDNVTVYMGQAEVTALATALMQHVQGIYTASWAAKDALP